MRDLLRNEIQGKNPKTTCSFFAPLPLRLLCVKILSSYNLFTFCILRLTFNDCQILTFDF